VPASQPSQDQRRLQSGPGEPRSVSSQR
jgi:hypothetical protein